MTVYETINHEQVRMWCEANGYWPGCLPGQVRQDREGLHHGRVRASQIMLRCEQGLEVALGRYHCLVGDVPVHEPVQR